MAHNRGSQRGVVQVASAAVLALFAALVAMTGCSAGRDPGEPETVGQLQQALTCGLTTCPVDTQCVTYSCNALNACVGNPVKDGTLCGSKFAPGQCLAGLCCTGCAAPVKGGGYACAKGTAVTACGVGGGLCANCDHGNSCETYACSAGQCSTTLLDDKTPCPGGACWKDACCTGCIDTNDTCQPGTDVANCGSSVNGLVGCGSCLDTDPCTTDACVNKACSNSAAPDNTPCPDATKCNGDEVCASGKCTGPANFSCDDNNVCTAESCDAQAGCAHAKLTGTSCADANKCNGDEVCNSGSCSAGTPLNCNDNNPCTTDGCAAATGCTNVKQNGTSCADANKCNGTEMCVTGVCTAGTPLSCDDGNPCTDDTCDPAGGCVHSVVMAGTKCDDGNVCNGISTCVGATCTAGAPLNCDDANVCTDDSCDPKGGCTHANNTAACSDNNLCTQGDKCDGNGACKGGAAPNCDDNEACTTDTCDPAKGCLHAAVADGGTCNDGNDCSTGDKCVAGKCKASGGKVCDDSNPCTQNSCDPAAMPATCTYPNETNGTPCTFDRCHQNSTCQAGACSQGEPINCDDANPCTTDSCDPVTGCTHVADNAAKCSDGDVCTSADHCKSGVCVGTDVVCSPLDECHEAGTCSAQSGVCDDPRSADNKPCKGGTCQSGKCVPDTTGAGGAGGDNGVAGDSGTVPQGGEPPLAMGGVGNEPGVAGEPGVGAVSGKGGKGSGGSTSEAAGSPDAPEHVFVRNPGGCSCSIPQEQGSNGLSWVGALALAAMAARRRRRQTRVSLS